VPRMPLGLGIAVIVTMIAIQLVPYGRATTRTRRSGTSPRGIGPRRGRWQPARASDCHSSETVWPGRLTPAERAMLIAGLEATFGAERARPGERRKKDDDD
jgi:hypothetical protein